MNANVYIIEDYENETAFRPKKTNPNKPNLPEVKLMQSCYNYGRKIYQIYQRKTLSLFEREGQTLCTYERALPR